MAFPGESSQMVELERLKEFIGDYEITNIHNLNLAKKNGMFVVVAWFDSIVEGVDMWFREEGSNILPRYRMKLKVKDGEDDVVFTLFDGDVEKLALVTCPLLASMGEPCSIYPNEVETIYGEPILFKVEKSNPGKNESSISLKVNSICNQISQLDLFFDTYLPEFHSKIYSSTVSLLPDLDEIPIIEEGCNEKEEGQQSAVLVSTPVSGVEDLARTVLKRTVGEIAAEVDEVKRKKVCMG